MGSRDDQTKPHQPLLSSLVVRPSDSGGGGGSGTTDYEPGEVRPDAPPHSRSDRYSDDHHEFVVATRQQLLRRQLLMYGYRTRAVSGSPIRHRDADRRYSSDFDHPGDVRQGRGRAAVRSPVRHRDYSPPNPRGRGRGRGMGRPFPKPLDDPGFGSGRFRGEARNNPNIRPRDGDWYCPDPACRNLNFARRDYCNSCSRHRDGPIRSPRRGYGGPPPPPFAPPRRFPAPPTDRFPGRFMGGYRSPPRGFPPRDIGPPPLRHDFRPPPPNHHYNHPLPRDRFDPFEDELRERAMFSRPPPLDWPARGDRGRDMLFSDRRGYDRRPPISPPPFGAHRDRWTGDRDFRDRSRSPFRGGPDRDRDRIGSVY